MHLKILFAKWQPFCLSLKYVKGYGAEYEINILLIHWCLV